MLHIKLTQHGLWYHKPYSKVDSKVDSKPEQNIMIRRDQLHFIMVQLHFIIIPYGRPKIKFLFLGATFHTPLTKSATLNRLFHCSLWQFSGALFLFSRALFCISGAKSPGAPVYFFLALRFTEIYDTSPEFSQKNNKTCYYECCLKKTHTLNPYKCECPLIHVLSILSHKNCSICLKLLHAW